MHSLGSTPGSLQHCPCDASYLNHLSARATHNGKDESAKHASVTLASQAACPWPLDQVTLRPHAVMIALLLGFHQTKSHSFAVSPWREPLALSLPLCGRPIKLGVMGPPNKHDARALLAGVSSHSEHPQQLVQVLRAFWGAVQLLQPLRVQPRD